MKKAMSSKQQSYTKAIDVNSTMLSCTLEFAY